MLQLEVEQARRYGLRYITDTRIPMPFLLVPVSEGHANMMSMARAEEEICRLDEDVRAASSNKRRKTSDSEISLCESQTSLKVIPR